MLTRSNKLTVILVAWLLVIFLFMFWVYQPSNSKFAVIGASILLLLFFLTFVPMVEKSTNYALWVMLVAYVVSMLLLATWGGVA